MDKHEVAHILDEIALFLEIKGDNPFKVRAYHNAARAIEGLDEEIEKVIEEDRLEEIPGIGVKIAKKIKTLINSGTLPYHQRLKNKIPPMVVELMDVPGLGAKKAAYLYKKLKIQSLEELNQACIDGKVAQLAGFGARTQENILKTLSMLKKYGKRFLWWNAGKTAYPLLEKLSELKEVERVDVAGSFRRKLETIGDLDFIVASSDPEPIMDWFTQQTSVQRIQAKGPTKSSVRLKGGIQADIRIVPAEQFPYALLYFTGSKDFNILLRQRANRLGYTLNEYGLQPLGGSGKRAIQCESEEAIFKALGLVYIPPELREGHAGFEAAMQDKVPMLIEDEDIKGVFHSHTTDSDGHNTLEEMAMAAQEIGWEYLGISDHSKSSYQANGMDELRLFEQMDKIERFNQAKKHPIKLLKGLECDISKEGLLDFPDDVLQQLDYVIISIHKSFKYDEKTMTARLIRAIEHPYSTMVGHLTGRLLLKREPYALNVSKVIDACIANRKIIEINGHPMRLDMDWRLWHKAADKGLLCAINPDAHSTAELRYVHAGVNIARKGWLQKEHVINTFPFSKMKQFLTQMRPAFK